jgi:hypothetical protein
MHAIDPNALILAYSFQYHNTTIIALSIISSNHRKPYCHRLANHLYYHMMLSITNALAAPAAITNNVWFRIHRSADSTTPS